MSYKPGTIEERKTNDGSLRVYLRSDKILVKDNSIEG
jgi:hypothetical protein